MGWMMWSLVQTLRDLIDCERAREEALQQATKKRAEDDAEFNRLYREGVAKMNGHFEVDNNAYPIGPLRVGDGYKVTDMRTLTTLHSHPISQSAASAICKEINTQIRNGADFLKNGREQALVGAVALALDALALPL